MVPLVIIGFALTIFYSTMLILTILNVHELRGRVHTKVLLRTQVIMILIEVCRLMAAISCVVQFWSDNDGINLLFDITVCTSQFLSITFAVA